MFDHLREQSLAQIAPARAKKKTFVYELQNDHKIQAELASAGTEQKIDGERFKLQTDLPAGEYLHGISSRVISKQTGRFTEKTDRVPHITKNPHLPKSSILDTELASSGDIVLLDLPGKFWDKMDCQTHPHIVWLRNKFNGALPVYPHVSHTASIMGSLGPEAVRKQEERGIIWAYIFDILRYNNQSVLHNKQDARRRFLASLLEAVPAGEGIQLMPHWPSLSIDEKIELFNLIVNIDGEGLVFKEHDKCYDHARAWWKLKKDYPIDAVLTGYYEMGKEGATGKMLGLVGTLEIAVWRDGLLVPVGMISAIMDSEAKLQELTRQAFAGELAGLVVECRHNGLQESGRLRHPRFSRWREDKDASECTWVAMLAEIENNKD